MPKGFPGSSQNKIKLVKVHEMLVNDIQEHANNKYGVVIPFTKATLDYAYDMRQLKERVKNSKGGNNFL